MSKYSKFGLRGIIAIALLIAAATAGPARGDAMNNPPPLGPILDLSGTPIPSFETYQLYSVNFVAAVANTDITFALREDPAFLSLGDISVTNLTTSSGNLLTNGDFSGGVYTNNGNPATPNGWEYANVFGATFGGEVESGAQDCYALANCWYDGAVQAYDAIDQIIGTTIGDTYHISFMLADNSDGSTFSDVSTNGDVTGTGGNGINLTVYAQSGLPPPATPEPSSFLLLGIGLAAVVVVSSRKTLQNLA